MKYKSWIILPVLFCSLTCSLHAEEEKVFIWKEKEITGFFIWELPTNRLDQLPKWSANEGEPPISVGKAIALANEWMKISKRNPYHSVGSVQVVTLFPVNPSYGKNREVFYYRVEYQIGPIGNHLTCVVLMDGTVLEPKIIPFKD